MELTEDAFANRFIVRIVLVDRSLLTACAYTELDDKNNLIVGRKFHCEYDAVETASAGAANRLMRSYTCTQTFRNWIEYQDVTDQVKRGEFNDPNEAR